MSNGKHNDKKDSRINIPNPLPIRVESSTEDNQRYALEEKDRGKQIRLAKGLNQITFLGAVVGLVTIGVLIISLRQSSHALQVDERAWVGTFHSCPVYPTDQTVLGQSDTIELCHFPKDQTVNPTGLNVFYRNNGKTPSLKTATYINWVPTEAKIPRGNPEFRTRPHGESTLQPNEVGYMTAHVPKAVLDGINQGEMEESGVVYGIIYYDDVFGFHHWSRFCVILGPHLSIAIHCQSYNETDDSPSNSKK